MQGSKDDNTRKKQPKDGGLPPFEGIARVPGVRDSSEGVSPAFRSAALDMSQASLSSSGSSFAAPFSAPTDAFATQARISDFGLREKKKTPPPSFAGYKQPSVPRNVEDVADEPTRRALSFNPTEEPVGSLRARAASDVAPSSFLNPTYREKVVLDTHPTIVKPILLLPPPWENPSLDKLPKCFPLERTHLKIKLDDCSLADVLFRLADSFRVMSIQAKFFGEPASAALLTPENVELYLALWKTSETDEIIVEVQRRRGDTVIAHQYSRHILDAASRNFDGKDFAHQEGSILYLQAAERRLNAEMAKIAPHIDMEKESVLALEIIYDLLTKDRRDARRLGMEGACILADPRKTVLAASLLMARALLLGGESATSNGLHEIILGVIQKREIGSDEIMDEYPEDSDEEEFFLDEDAGIRNRSPAYKEEITLLRYLALNALSHALEVATTFGLGTTEISDPALAAASVVDAFLLSARASTDIDMLTTLLGTLQHADVQPHNAWLAARCLRHICTASPEACQRTLKLGGEGVLWEALGVGEQSHAKLESECRLLQGVLTK